MNAATVPTPTTSSPPILLSSGPDRLTRSRSKARHTTSATADASIPACKAKLGPTGPSETSQREEGAVSTRPDLAGDHPESGLGDAVLDAGDRLVVGRSCEQLVGRHRLGERRAGEAKMRRPQPARCAHCASLSESSATKPGSGTSL